MNAIQDRVNEAIALIKAGSKIDDACRQAKISTVTYYKYKNKKTKKPTPHIQTIVTPHNQSKIAVILCDADSIADVLKGLS